MHCRRSNYPVPFVIAQIIYLFSPLLLSAAVSAVVLRFDLLRALRRPIDAGRSLGGRRIFGDSKTWRGVVVPVAGCVAGVALQKVFAADTRALALIDYRAVSPVWFGAAMGAGAMLGELPNSFVKRRLGIPPGKTARGWMAALFYVWDQVDLLTGAWPLLAPWVHPSARIVLPSVVLALAIHPLVALIGYLVGARKSPR